MKYTCTVISVADINAARKFYEELFGLEVYQDYGRNIAFTCGLALQQDFDWLTWKIPTHILYGEKDNLTAYGTIFEFAQRTNSTLSIMKNGEHWFHTEEQMKFLDEWINKSAK